MIEISEVTKAIEASNAAFEVFKAANDARLKKMEEGKAGQSDDMATMVKSFDAVTAQSKAVKELLETLEAKQNRKVFVGSDGKEIPEIEAEHKSAFGGYMRKGKEYDLALEQKALNISASGDGGFAVPKVIDGMIDSLIVNISPIRSIATVQQISTSDYHKLINTRGTASGWVGEQANRPSTSTPTLVDIAPPMGELYANPQVTQQMLDDVFFNAESWLAGEVATEFARAEGAAFVTGSGVNQPRGFLAGNAPVATGDATRAFGTLEFVGTGASGAFKTLSGTVNPVDDLYTVIGKLKAGYRSGSNWVMNKDTLFKVAAFKDFQGRYVFSPTSAPGVADAVLGYPVVEAEDMPSLAANSFSIAFGNFKSGYLIVDRIGTRVIRDPFSNKPYIGFYTTKRVGGALTNSEAIKLLKFI